MARLGVDVGGTFTDIIVESDGAVRVAKVPSTADQADGVMDGIAHLGVSLPRLERFAHGTTVATNAVLERSGARTVLVTTGGFRDLLEIGRQDRPDLYDLAARRPPPLVPRNLVVEVTERLDSDGQVVTPLEEPGAVAARVAELEPEAVAVCLLFSFLDDGHERALVDALADGPFTVSRSSDVLPVFREYERASTTALNAYVSPRLSRYLTRLEERLRAGDLHCPVEVMRSGGGTFTADVAGRYPVHTLLSGPAAGAWGAAASGRAAGYDDVIAFDMGGTSTDVTLVHGGRPATTADGAIGDLPFAVPTTDVHTVGAGGGSIAWRDPGGSLRVGPRSAGAHPGPAAYGRGGERPTVTDAHVVLGRLHAPLAGAIELQPEAARDAVSRLTRELGLAVVACAEGIVAVAEATMARALRVVSVERGHDPRDFALLAFGGAGPLHQAALARELGCGTVLVPPHAGVLAALGLLAAPTVAEAVRTHLRSLERATAAELGPLWAELERRARDTLAGQGAPVERVRRGADLRYRGQAHELEVDAPDGGDPDALVTAFHAAHDDRYGYAQPDQTVELVNLRVRVEGPDPAPPLPELPPGDGAEGARTGSHVVVVDGQEGDCPVYDRGRLGAGDRLRGPAIVADLDTTCLVAPDQVAEVDRLGALVMSWR